MFLLKILRAMRCLLSCFLFSLRSCDFSPSSCVVFTFKEQFLILPSIFISYFFLFYREFRCLYSSEIPYQNLWRMDRVANGDDGLHQRSALTRSQLVLPPRLTKSRRAIKYRRLLIGFLFSFLVQMNFLYFRKNKEYKFFIHGYKITIKQWNTRYKEPLGGIFTSLWTCFSSCATLYPIGYNQKSEIDAYKSVQKAAIVCKHKTRVEKRH